MIQCKSQKCLIRNGRAASDVKFFNIEIRYITEVLEIVSPNNILHKVLISYLNFDSTILGHAKFFQCVLEHRDDLDHNPPSEHARACLNILAFWIELCVDTSMVHHIATSKAEFNELIDKSKGGII